MKGPFFALTFMLLLSGFPADAQPTKPTAPSAIRDIRGPLQPTGLPPFSRTALLLVVGGLGLAVAARARRGRSHLVISSSEQLPAIDDIAALRDAYARREVSAQLLFQQLTAIVGSRLVEGDSHAMTSVELLEAAGEKIPAEMMKIATDLFGMSDRVRFGGYHPDNAEVDAACAAVQMLLRCPPGTVL